MFAINTILNGLYHYLMLKFLLVSLLVFQMASSSRIHTYEPYVTSHEVQNGENPAHDFLPALAGFTRVGFMAGRAGLMAGRTGFMAGRTGSMAARAGQFGRAFGRFDRFDRYGRRANSLMGGRHNVDSRL